MNIYYVQNGIRGEIATDFQGVSSARKSGISGGTYKGREYLNLLNHGEHMEPLNFICRPLPRV